VELFVDGSDISLEDCQGEECEDNASNSVNKRLAEAATDAWQVWNNANPCAISPLVRAVQIDAEAEEASYCRATNCSQSFQ